MNRYYNPTTGTILTKGIDDITNAIAREDMPASSQKWFDEDPPPDGMQWVTDPVNSWPILEPIPAPTRAEQEALERFWAQEELRRTDFILLADSPYTEPHRALVRTYRASLRNPTRTTHPTFPAATWRPAFPSGVKVPD